MKIYYFEKVSLFIIGFLTYCVVPAHAQVQKQDSLHQTVSLQHVTDDTHNLRLKEVLIPTAVIGASALFVHNGWLTKQRENVQNVLSAKGKYKFKLDDHSQYAPMVAVYGLNLCGIKGKHGFKDRTIILAMSYATVGILVNTMKFVFKEKRPDSNARNSFPSGHTATAFMGAEFLYKEYKDVSPWIGYTGYAVAATTGYLRIYNNRHYINDVIAGACIGITSVKLTYWLYSKCFKKAKCNKATFASVPYYSSDGWGMNMCIVF
ncbi:phosphatase PAP2 family protein [Butyricimonas faecalis]|uniref:Phosphatase PAP2 family protein n=1 Tax=Butyricimonas faecalis TaxID=2093856 RepID=A0A3S9VRE7_9BACT|nr:phosphatase PAP2 family protein [Butyricimonas faecalis]AZS29095.1 phosphatase PAP2 family protein [Butyricimonas faecalis]